MANKTKWKLILKDLESFIIPDWDNFLIQFNMIEKTLNDLRHGKKISPKAYDTMITQLFISVGDKVLYCEDETVKHYFRTRLFVKAGEIKLGTGSLVDFLKAQRKGTIIPTKRLPNDYWEKLTQTLKPKRPKLQDKEKLTQTLKPKRPILQDKERFAHYIKDMINKRKLKKMQQKTKRNLVEHPKK